MTIGKLLRSLTVCSLCLLASHALRADLIQQVIKNHAADTSANDLTLVFTEPVEFVVVRDKDGKSTRKDADPPSTDVTFKTGNLPSSFLPANGNNPADPAKIRFEAPKGTRIDQSEAFWTENSAEIVDGLATLGAPPTLSNIGGIEFASFTNPDSVSLLYSSVLLYANNSMANFNLDQFDVPTGQLVTGLPSSFVLDPGQSVQFSFGPVEGSFYQLAMADVSTVSDPGDVYQVADAAAPEPSTFTLLGTGCLAMIAIRKRAQAIHQG